MWPLSPCTFNLNESLQPFIDFLSNSKPGDFLNQADGDEDEFTAIAVAERHPRPSEPSAKRTPETSGVFGKGSAFLRGIFAKDPPASTPVRQVRLVDPRNSQVYQPGTENGNARSSLAANSELNEDALIWLLSRYIQETQSGQQARQSCDDEFTFRR